MVFDQQQTPEAKVERTVNNDVQNWAKDFAASCYTRPTQESCSPSAATEKLATDMAAALKWEQLTGIYSDGLATNTKDSVYAQMWLDAMRSDNPKQAVYQLAAAFNKAAIDNDIPDRVAIKNEQGSLSIMSFRKDQGEAEPPLEYQDRQAGSLSQIRFPVLRDGNVIGVDHIVEPTFTNLTITPKIGPNTLAYMDSTGYHEVPAQVATSPPPVSDGQTVAMARKNAAMPGGQP